MNPFVDPKKRSVTLPAGCKDLIDVLNQKKSTDGETIRRLIVVILFQAQADHATELVIGKASASGKTPVSYKAGEKWHELSPFPSEIRPNVISKLAQMANFAFGQTAGKGAFDLYYGGSRVRWAFEITDADAECRLFCTQD